MPSIQTTPGIALVDKAGGFTSHDVVAKARRAIGTRKVGHAGTLDPMATGLLILGVNSATRLLTWMVGLDKEYQAVIRLGASTPTDDAESEADLHAASGAIASVTEGDIASHVARLSGDILQVPSSVSAIKVDGKRSYARVRAGEKVELAARAVTVSAFDVLARDRVTTGGHDYLDLSVRIECTSGTYIRALARDLGAVLGVGGHLTMLRRTRIGPFRVEEAGDVDDLTAETLISPATAAAELFPTVNLTAQQAVDIVHGKAIDSAPLPDASGPIAAVAPDGRLLALIERRGASARSVVVFPQTPMEVQ